MNPDRYVAIPATTASMLVEHALNELAYSVQSVREDLPDWKCCAQCCGPCAALVDLVTSGMLDDIVRERAVGYDWWLESEGRVDPEYINDNVRFSCERCS